MKKDLYKRFEIIESHLPVYRSELFKQMETTEARMLNKLKELKDALSQTILTNFTALDDRVDQFSELVRSDYYFNLLGGQQLRNSASGVAGQSRGVRKHHQQDQRRRRAKEQQPSGRPRKNYRRGLLSPCQSRIGREEASRRHLQDAEGNHRLGSSHQYFDNHQSWQADQPNPRLTQLVNH